MLNPGMSLDQLHDILILLRNHVLFRFVVRSVSCSTFSMTPLLWNRWEACEGLYTAPPPFWFYWHGQFAKQSDSSQVGILRRIRKIQCYVVLEKPRNRYKHQIKKIVQDLVEMTRDLVNISRLVQPAVRFWDLLYAILFFLFADVLEKIQFKLCF